MKCDGMRPVLPRDAVTKCDGMRRVLPRDAATKCDGMRCVPPRDAVTKCDGMSPGGRSLAAIAPVGTMRVTTRAAREVLAARNPGRNRGPRNPRAEIAPRVIAIAVVMTGASKAHVVIHRAS